MIYEIDEGPLAKITKINFIGNKHYSDSDLQGEILSKETRWWRIFSSSENYDPEKSNYDKELLRRFYNNHGYADFRVVSSVAELSPDSQSFVITTVLEEGVRYKIKKVNITSEIPDMNTAGLADDLDIEAGDWYNAAKVEKSVYALTEELGKRGYAFVEVEPELDRNMQTGEMTINFRIKEGARVFINRININGNSRTYDEVIRREFRISEGDAFNAAKIRASRRNIENLNYFSKVDIETQPTSDDNKADINVNVTEKSTGYFNVGLGSSLVLTWAFPNVLRIITSTLPNRTFSTVRCRPASTCLKTKPTIRTRLLMTKTPWAAVCVWDGNIPTTFIRASAIPCVRMRSKTFTRVLPSIFRKKKENMSVQVSDRLCIMTNATMRSTRRKAISCLSATTWPVSAATKNI